MNDEDIKFGEIEDRPIEPGVRPDQGREFAVVPYGRPDSDDGQVRIYISLDAFADIETHASSDTSVELGGVLLGKQHVDDRGRPFVWVTENLRAKHYQSSLSRFTYTHETWGEITREKDEQYPDLDIVGWYHTHPGWGIFLSGHDIFIHENFFSRPLDTAYVVDPVNNDRGFFYWKEREGGDRTLPQNSGYYVVAPRAQRAALEDTVARVEGRRMPELTAAGGGLVGGGAGHGPPIIVQTPGGRGGVLGPAALAVLALLVMTQMAVLLVMYQRDLDRNSLAEKRLLEQQIERLEKAQGRIGDLERVETRLAGERAALSALLGEVKIDNRPFLAKYAETAEALREQERAAGTLGARLELQAAGAEKLVADNARLKAELDRSTREVDRLAAQKVRAEELDRKLAALSKERDTLAAENRAFRDRAEDYQKFVESKDKLAALDEYESAASNWRQLAVFVLLPLALLGAAGSYSLYRQTRALREEIDELAAARSKAGKKPTLAEPPAAPSASGSDTPDPVKPEEPKPGEMRID
jgi:proteasome lid subunit RPN8/RPN11